MDTNFNNINEIINKIQGLNLEYNSIKNDSEYFVQCDKFKNIIDDIIKYDELFEYHSIFRIMKHCIEKEKCNLSLIYPKLLSIISGFANKN